MISEEWIFIRLNYFVGFEIQVVGVLDFSARMLFRRQLTLQFYVDLNFLAVLNCK